MLVLSRKNNQSVIIQGPDGLEHLVKITVLATNGGSAKLGFQAKGDIVVHREEIWERIRAKDGLLNGGPTPPALERWEDDGGGSDPAAVAEIAS